MEYLHSLPKTHFGGNPLRIQMLPAGPNHVMETRRLLLKVPRTVAHQVHRRHLFDRFGKPQHLRRRDHQTKSIDAHYPSVATTPILPQTVVLPRRRDGDLDGPSPSIFPQNLFQRKRPIRCEKGLQPLLSLPLRLGLFQGRASDQDHAQDYARQHTLPEPLNQAHLGPWLAWMGPPARLLFGQRIPRRAPFLACGPGVPLALGLATA